MIIISDNRTLRLNYSNTSYVILAKMPDNHKRYKYIAKGFRCRTGFNYTVLLNRALKFNSIEAAEHFMSFNEIDGIILMNQVNSRIVDIHNIPASIPTCEVQYEKH